MRVLVVNDQYSRSSAAGAAVSMAEAVAADGEDVHFLGSVQNRDETGAFEAHGLHVRNLHVPPYRLRWRAYRSLNHAPAVRAFESAAREIEPQLIHFHNVHMHWSYGALRSASRMEVPVVLSVHDVMPFCCHKMFCFLDETLTPNSEVDYRAHTWRCLKCQRFRFNPYRNQAIRKAITQCVDCVAPVSRPMAAALEQNRIPVNEVIYNGIDCDDWKPAPEEGKAFRRRHGLEEARIVLHGGRLDYLKGGLHLVRAVAALRPGLPGVRLMVLGRQSPFLEQMISLAESLGVKDALFFPGWLQGGELRAAYAAADLIASPSLCFESFNLMNLEGMAMARPVVSSFFGGPSEVVVDQETGFLVNPLDESDLTEKISRLLLDGELADRMGRKGRQRAEQAFSIKNTGKRLIRLYGQLIKCKIK